MIHTKLLWVAAGPFLCLVALSAATTEASPILVGPPVGEAAVYETVIGYNSYVPFVQIGAASTPIEIEVSEIVGPILKIFQVTLPRYHHLHIIEHWQVTNSTLYDWNELLMVPDGEGGWEPSGNYDDLWWSCYADVTPRITPLPQVLPVPTCIDITNLPDDLVSFCWDDGLTDGQQIVIDHWLTVPASLSRFAILEYPTVVMPVPEPATMFLLGLGLLGIAVRRKRR